MQSLNPRIGGAIFFFTPCITKGYSFLNLVFVSVSTVGTINKSKLKIDIVGGVPSFQV